MKKRREFLSQIVKAGFATVALQGNLSVLHASTTRKAFKVDNPYEGVDWDKCLFVPSASHVHIENQEKLDKIYHVFGLRHIPISNYYPPAPCYPADKILQNQFMVEQEFEVVYNPDDSKPGSEKWKRGVLKKGPIEWNKIIMDEKTGWYASLSEEQKNNCPLKQAAGFSLTSLAM